MLELSLTNSTAYVTGDVQEESFFGYKHSDARIDPDTGKIQEHGLLDWKDSGQRIDPKSGKLQEEGLFGWKDATSARSPKSSAGYSDSDAQAEVGYHSFDSILAVIGLIVGGILGASYAISESKGVSGFFWWLLGGGFAGCAVGLTAGSALRWALPWIMLLLFIAFLSWLLS